MNARGTVVALVAVAVAAVIAVLAMRGGGAAPGGAPPEVVGAEPVAAPAPREVADAGEGASEPEAAAARTPAAATGFTVRARLLDERGAPVAGVELTVVCFGPGQPVRGQADSGADGRVAVLLTPDPPAQTTLRYGVRNPEYASTHGAVEVREATVAARSLDLGDLVLGDLHIVEGTVVDVEGVAVADASVALQSPPVVTGPDGRFSLDRVPSGRHAFQIQIAGAPAIVEVPGDVRVPDDAVGGVRVVVRRPGIVAGRVLDDVDQPPSGAWVIAENDKGIELGKAPCGRDGRFRIAVQAPKVVGDGPRLWVYSDGRYACDGKRAVAWGEQGIELRVREAPMGSLLILTEDKGEPVEQVSVWIDLPPESREAAPWVRMGAYPFCNRIERGRLPLPAVGLVTQNLHVFPQDSRYAAVTVEVRGDGAVREERVLVPRTVEVAVEVEPPTAGVTVTGDVIDGVTPVAMMPMAGGSKRTPWPVKTDADGHALLRIGRPGERWAVKVFRGAFEMGSREVVLPVREPLRFTIAELATVRLRLSAAEVADVLRGVLLVDENGRPVAGAGREELSFTPELLLRDVPFGTYDVTARHGPMAMGFVFDGSGALTVGKVTVDAREVTAVLDVDALRPGALRIATTLPWQGLWDGTRRTVVSPPRSKPDDWLSVLPGRYHVLWSERGVVRCSSRAVDVIAGQRVELVPEIVEAEVVIEVREADGRPASGSTIVFGRMGAPYGGVLGATDTAGRLVTPRWQPLLVLHVDGALVQGGRPFRCAPIGEPLQVTLPPR